MDKPSSGQAAFALLLGALALFGVLWGSQRPTPAWANSCPQELIQRVNALRAQNGLPPYRVDPILMAVAQAHSEYQASIRQGTHIGPNGDHPRDRVRAAGYGGEAAVFVSENIAWGTSSYVSPAWAVQIWTEDAPHLHTMLGENYRDVGAGCAEGGGKTYFTLDAAYYIGEPQPTGEGNGEVATPVPPAPTAEPVIVATPNADGAVIHAVGQGQTLLQIALAYGVPLEEILRLNGLTESSIIYPGQKIVIRAGASPTPTVSPSPTLRPTSTHTPSPSPTVSPTMEALSSTPSAAPPTPTPSPASKKDGEASAGSHLLLWGLAGALLAGALAYGLMAVLARLEGE
ncbi:MAG TPA: LysM peptidoglycan-binding domain-containing protein [Anaerolineae bacterium]|nr:LysM peptidoglycan-binding domain-containing protein [Anaerolineae bacterium]HID84371.1 LysM peptidoglycan-binding domain-containing protein [Anaerolineales bacterium]HIQ08772.1 LysM peptidoglycan-binding domain-containing protein [Anaerolineaceae bacterium]